MTRPLFKKLPHQIEWLRGKWIFIGDAFLGDNGKGKISLFLIWFLQEHGIVVALASRPNGGNNAGHGAFAPWGPYGPQEMFTCNVVPIAIIYGIPVLICRGAIIHPRDLIERELAQLAAKNVDIQKISISYGTHLTLPHYFILEKIQEHLKGKGKVGTTGRAIGPTYEFQKNRAGIRIIDLLDMKTCAEKIRHNHQLAELTIRGANPPWWKFWRERFQIIPVTEVIDEVKYYRDALLRMAVDEDKLYQDIRERGQVGVAEMGQGTDLDNLSDEYPYVTASSTTIPGGLAQAGLSPKDLGYGILVCKGPYWTRVGGGPFPTEMEPELAAKFRQMGNEFGATTGRPRRCGWANMERIEKAVKKNGADCVCLTKMDVAGPYPMMLQARNTNGYFTKIANWPQNEVLGKTNYDELPLGARYLTDYYNRQIGQNLVHLISTGPSLEHMVVMNDFLKKP